MLPNPLSQPVMKYHREGVGIVRGAGAGGGGGREGWEEGFVASTRGAEKEKERERERERERV